MKKRSKFTGKPAKVLGTKASRAKPRSSANKAERASHERNETREQQLAAREVLEVIARSHGQLQPIFENLLRHATQLCGAKFGTLYLHERGGLRLVAARDVPRGFFEARADIIDVAPGGVLETAVKTKRTAHVVDLAATKAVRERHRGMVEAVELAGIRTVVAVPMLNGDELIGIIAIHRCEAVPFAEDQIELLAGFAAQAVIAVENARLRSELRRRTTDLAEALEQQKATSDLLQVISGSPGVLDPVFHAMLKNAVGICGANLRQTCSFTKQICCAQLRCTTRRKHTQTLVQVRRFIRRPRAL